MTNNNDRTAKILYVYGDDDDAQGYYRVQASSAEGGPRFDVYRTERHPRGVELIGGWPSLDLAADAARRYLAVDRREGVLP